MSYAIYLVEDEDSLRDLIVSYLERASYAPRAFPDAERAREALEDGADLWILDINLPGIDGFEFLNMIRDTDPEVPVIYISARDRDIDRVVGLEVGADDYLPKPFLPRELVIRVNRILSRVYGDRERQGTDTTRFQIGAYVLDSVKREVRSDRGRIDLTSKEIDLLYLFAVNRGRAFSRDQLIDRIWGTGYHSSERVVDDLVRRLRGKLKDLPLETIYGFGYRMDGS